jgi:hypothetical protein
MHPSIIFFKATQKTDFTQIDGQRWSVAISPLPADSRTFTSGWSPIANWNKPPGRQQLRSIIGAPDPTIIGFDSES